MGKCEDIHAVYRELKVGEFRSRAWKFWRTQIKRDGVEEREEKPS